MLVIVSSIFIIAMKTQRQRKNNKKKNYGSSSIPKELKGSKWWQLVFKLKSKQQSIFKLS
jgi:hypothetical protein